MPKPRNWSWNPTAQRWEQKGRDGLLKAYSDETGLGGNRLNIGTQADIQRLLVGSGSNINFMLGFTGTSALLTAIGVEDITVGTITNATGIAAGDKIFGVPKELTMNTSKAAIAAFYVPTNNVLNVHIANIGTMAGSLPALGWDIMAMRSS